MTKTFSGWESTYCRRFPILQSRCGFRYEALSTLNNTIYEIQTHKQLLLSKVTFSNSELLGISGFPSWSSCSPFRFINDSDSGKVLRIRHHATCSNLFRWWRKAFVVLPIELESSSSLVLVTLNMTQPFFIKQSTTKQHNIKQLGMQKSTKIGFSTVLIQ